VSFLMTSPLAKGLFRRAIAESGTVTTLGDARSLAEAEGEGEALMNRVDVAGPRTLAALRHTSATDILKVEPPYLTSPPRSLLAVVDGYVLPKQPAAVFSAGRAHRVPLIIGSTARERVPIEES
jgi:para-nitrobenzyl esterase